MMRLFGLIQIQWFIYILGCWINIFSSTTSVPTDQSIIASTFDVTYLLVNDNSLSLSDLNSIDRVALARTLEQNIQLSEQNILQIKSITIEKINHNQFLSCIRNATDAIRPLITFQIVPVYPIGLSYQTQTSIDVLIRQIQQRFESLSTLSIQIQHILCIFRFCSIDIHSVSFVGNMTSGRMYHASTFVLQDNSILITGGFNPSTISALATTNKFIVVNDSLPMAPSKNMSTARYDHTADLVPSSGLVLIAGGMNSAYMPHHTAELFNPISGVTNVISMSTDRATHKSAMIPNSNKIVLIGGQNSSYIPINTGDVFDGTHFAMVPNTMMTGRVGHTVTFLPTINIVLITGGSNSNTDDLKFFDTVELYNVTANRFQRLSNVRMSSRRAGHTATYIPAPFNKVLIVGGGSNETNVLNTFDIFDVSTMSFGTSGTMKKKRTFHTATLLKNERTVLFAGGRTSVTDDQLAPCELFDPATMTSMVLKCLNEPRFFHTATLIPPTGNVLMCGGVDSNKQVLASCERFEP